MATHVRRYGDVLHGSFEPHITRKLDDGLTTEEKGVIDGELAKIIEKITPDMDIKKFSVEIFKPSWVNICMNELFRDATIDKQHIVHKYFIGKLIEDGVIENKKELRFIYLKGYDKAFDIAGLDRPKKTTEQHRRKRVSTYEFPASDAVTEVISEKHKETDEEKYTRKAEEAKYKAEHPEEFPTKKEKIVSLAKKPKILYKKPVTWGKRFTKFTANKTLSHLE